MDKRLKKEEVYTTGDYLKFILPSLIGIFLFVIPLSINGEFTISVALMAGFVQTAFGEALPYIATILITIAALLSLFTKIIQPSLIINRSFLNKLFNVSWIWQITRLLGMIFSIIALFKIGPNSVWSEATGGLLLFDLIPVLFSVFLFAGLFLPLLLNFGLLELCGALFTKIMRPLFTLPGRSSIDCLASWLGDGTIGVLLTNKQYEDGYYTKREAAVIGTTFSVVSITFTIVIMSYLDLEKYFFSFYLTIVIAGLACAFISPRIPPLSRKSNTLYNETEKIDETIPSDISSIKWGLQHAIKQARGNKFTTNLKGGIENVLDMWLGVLPIVMAIGTLALIIAEYTPLFKILGYPFIPVLELMQIPEASEASQTMLIGFADMFLPAIIGSGIESEMTRFVIGCLSITQLIYMSEVGGLLLGSKLPVSFLDLVLIFLQRTIISLPIIVVIAHIIF
ncbi:nucleoside recognition membrane protein YjiH [Metabacillus crassostreae]|uniref:YjiH family protein n=1 Tax=Metabacillus crassostreae TaxID=929098 RepID=UPI0019561442|nr:YjiH family protein [Metabacillus crassostreae]MBM7603721.1 nucleoside recognition membrane protein YjiH [Metabacillus crassostreae]